MVSLPISGCQGNWVLHSRRGLGLFKQGPKAAFLGREHYCFQDLIHAKDPNTLLVLTPDTVLMILDTSAKD